MHKRSSQDNGKKENNATSEVTISKDRLLSWDRGWNSDDVQVWGAVNGAYVFVKEKG